jgi:hypothetical protein
MVPISVPSPYHFRLSCAAGKSRLIRSGAPRVGLNAGACLGEELPSSPGLNLAAAEWLALEGSGQGERDAGHATPLGLEEDA